MKHCGKCEHAKEVVTAPFNWKFIGCYCKPYRGKRVSEIEQCPKEYVK